MGSPNCPMVVECYISGDDCDCIDRIYCATPGYRGHEFCGYSVVDGICYAEFNGGQGSKDAIFKQPKNLRGKYPKYGN